MTNELPQGPAEWDAMHPYASLTPDAVLDALADIGLMGDGRLIALSSYENRVYQIQLETERAPAQTDGTPVPESVVAKFYRPGRWTRAFIFPIIRSCIIILELSMVRCYLPMRR